jgi:hypothetical protein
MPRPYVVSDASLSEILVECSSEVSVAPHSIRHALWVAQQCRDPYMTQILPSVDSINEKSVMEIRFFESDGSFSSFLLGYCTISFNSAVTHHGAFQIT